MSNQIKIENELPKEADEEKIGTIFSECVEAFQKGKPNVGEILLAYGNLGYTLGASIEGFDGKGPSIEELEKMYYENPTVGVALMLQGILVTTWLDDYAKKKP